MTIKSLLMTGYWFAEARVWNTYCRFVKAKEQQPPTAFNLKFDSLCTEYIKQKADNLPLIARPIEGALEVPRSSGGESTKQIMIMEQCKSDAHNCYTYAIAASKLEGVYYSIANNYLQEWVNKCGKPMDGGSTLDWFLAREEGDTPICICEHFTLFAYSMLICPSLQTPERIAWLQQYADYVMSYRPGVLNNHIVWKALFLLSFGILSNNKKYWSEGVRHHDKYLAKLAKDGIPIELARGEVAASYTRMALEALIHCDILRGTKSQGVLPVFKDFMSCLDNIEAWTDTHKDWTGGKGQRRPNNINEWRWIEVLYVRPSFRSEAFGYMPTESYVSDWATWVEIV